MKLTAELKARIDSYFDGLSADELYRISLLKYGFSEDLSFGVKGEPFDHVRLTKKYQSSVDFIELSASDVMPHAT